ncbi:MAG: branched-chain amino acid ABC transporter permease [Deltaproteobacteria bacterium]|nr:branched-chain amino acid ABC transporter permease [Deltaproteobacteria bacterium]
MAPPAVQTVVELLLGGVSLGGLYGMMAFAFSLALATTRILNVAHGGFLVLGAALAMLFFRFLHLHFLLGTLLLLAIFLLVGLLFEGAFVRPLMGRPPHAVLVGSILVTFGFALALEAFLGFYWADLVDPQPSFTIPFPAPTLQVFGLTLSGTRLTILAIAMLTAGLFHLLLTRTKMGKAARAMSEDHEGALIIGINPRRLSIRIYLVGVVVTAFSGILSSTTAPLEPYSGLPLTMIALTIIVIGGVGSLPGALLGGVLVGTAEVLTTFLAGGAWAPVVYLLVFFLVLVVRPEGLFGVREA